MNLTAQREPSSSLRANTTNPKAPAGIKRQAVQAGYLAGQVMLKAAPVKRPKNVRHRAIFLMLLITLIKLLEKFVAGIVT